MWTMILLALMGLAGVSVQGRPSYLDAEILPTYGHHPHHHHHVEYAPTIIGHAAYSVPAAISHQSQTIVHEKRPYLRPIVGHTPIYKTAYPAHYVKSSYLPTTASLGIPTVYSDLGYDSYYGSDWNPSLSSYGWIK